MTASNRPLQCTGTNSLRQPPHVLKMSHAERDKPGSYCSMCKCKLQGHNLEYLPSEPWNLGSRVVYFTFFAANLLHASCGRSRHKKIWRCDTLGKVFRKIHPKSHLILYPTRTIIELKVNRVFLVKLVTGSENRICYEIRLKCSRIKLSRFYSWILTTLANFSKIYL